MKPLHAYLAITAAALTFAVFQLSASAAPEYRRADPGKLKTMRPIMVDAPCAPHFRPSKTNLIPRPGSLYTCTYQFYVKCKKGFYPNNPVVTRVGNGWVVRYGCMVPPH